MKFEEQHERYLVRCEEAIHAVTGRFFMPLSTVSEAAQYSLLNGGKRVRGVLTLAVCDFLEGDFQIADTFAAALEMIHAFWLVHDDLPSMDNDDVRRGKPSNHIVYGEATALLAGDLLAIEAFEAIAAAPFAPHLRAKGIEILAGAAGARGMIYGQELDLKYENESPDEAALCAVHRNKTGALLMAAARLGTLAAGETLENVPSLVTYTENVGMVFQIVDDILDATADPEVLGKPVGSDAQQHKTTFVTLMGLEESRREVSRLTQQAIASLTDFFGDRAAFLCEFAARLAERVK